MTNFDEWFESLHSMDETDTGVLILMEESLERCSKKQDPELRAMPEGSALRKIMQSF